MTATSPQQTNNATTLAPETPGLLERNLAALSRLSPESALEIGRVSPSGEYRFLRSGDGGLTAEIQGRPVASRRNAIAEGERLAAGVDIKTAAVVVVIGFGVGHHVRAIAEKLQRTGLVVVFEPDAALLKGTLEREDCASWMTASNLIIVTDESDAAVLGTALRRHEAMLGLGVTIVEHPGSTTRIGDRSRAFLETFAQVAATARTALVTTMVQTESTVRNVLMNLDYYAGAPGIAELRECAINRPAVVVSAGPSLERNMRLLARDGVRDRCVIIAVQTALKPLLRAGIRPHYVVALDHHEISRRFYEGLRSEDVAGVTLVVEPKANPAILQTFPGPIRCAREEYLDLVLGERLFRDHGSVPPGSTVAHLAYYLARFMGCDPVALIGQDLGFTDGQYYASGAAIHEVWAGELNPFNTLESLEWQRIVRGRASLHRVTDHLGRSIYTDEQMRTYLAQFERDFRSDESKGLTIIDATEGGVRKAHTTRRTLAEFLEEHAPEDAPSLRLPPPPTAELNRDAVRSAAARVREVRRGVWRIGDLSRKASALLAQMLEHHEDQPRVNRLIGKVHALRDEAVSEATAYHLVHRFNQTGTFRRARADRAIIMSEDEPESAQQLKNIERDLQNVRWLGEAADALGELLDVTARAMEGGPKRTRDLMTESQSDPDNTDATVMKERPRVAALVSARFDHGALGGTRTLGPRPWTHGRAALALTVERIARTPGLDRVIVLTDDPVAASKCLDQTSTRVPVEIEPVALAAWEKREDAIRAGRVFAGWCWRGGPGHLSAYDEAILPRAMSDVMESRALSAALVLGGDWCAADPAIAGALIERHAEMPERFRVAFTQAAPGLAPALIDRHVMTDLARVTELDDAGAFASFGGLIGYVPIRPKVDPIAQPVCLVIDPAVRDAMARWIADGSEGESLLAHASERLGTRFSEASALELVQAAADALPEAPGHVIFELTTARLTSGRRAAWARGRAIAADPGEPIPTRQADISRIEHVIRALSEVRDDLVVTFGGSGDPTLHPSFGEAVEAAKRAGARAVHVRTDLLAEDADIAALLRTDVVSVDLLADSKETYEALTGVDGFDRVTGNMERLINARRQDPDVWLGAPWVMPRMTRCDAVYEELESFYDRWLLWLGCATLDPLPDDSAPDRIARLPLPRAAATRFARDRMLVLADGRVVADERDAEDASSVGNAFDEPPLDVWRRLVAAREAGGEPARAWTMYA